MKQGLDACVVSYRTPDLLRSCVGSYLATAPEGSTLSLRVNDPSGRDMDVIDEFGDSIDHVEFGSNLGYARSINQLVQRGQSGIIGIFNADVLFLDDTLGECAAALRDNDDWGVLGPRSVNSANRITHAGIFGKVEKPFLRGWKKIDHGQFNDTREAVSVSGSAYFVKRSVWDELTTCPQYVDFCSSEGLEAEGAFLPTEHYYEDTYCSYHASHHGHKVMYYGPVSIIHEWHQSSPEKDPLDTRRMKEAREIYRKACAYHGIRCE